MQVHTIDTRLSAWVNLVHNVKLQKLHVDGCRLDCANLIEVGPAL